ncbi:hypothetical protein [Desulfovibrio sp. Fe33]|uniref:hypothetical protein n=1 Tax=Desulfovibrio sp. Fe33 TaxID=3020842 RepID=UPI00234C76B8|nr:hypothetical protein [Desulfovibrio sp. Fe33]
MYACAEDSTASREWQFELTPYLWFINISGDTSVRGNSGTSDMEYSKISDMLEESFAVYHEGHNGEFGYIVDASYMQLKGEEDTAIGSVGYKSEQTVLEVLGFYSQHVLSDSRIDYLAGIRYNDAKITLSRNNSYSRGIDWVDPVVGLRWVTHINDKSKISIRGDIGGFGLGSQHTLMGAVTYDYNPWKHFGFKVGVKAVNTYYTQEKNSYKTDSTTWGPLVGFNILW